MQGLMYRLAELDADSAGLVRVIDYFDALVRHGADSAALLRASAALADCVVGMDVPGWPGGGHRATRCDPRGRWVHGPAGQPSAGKDVVIDDAVVGSVWLERAGHSLALDDMLVDRMALTAAIILQPRRSPTDAEHTRNLLFPMDEMAVLTSCAALKIDPLTTLRVAACAGTVTPAVIAGVTVKRTTGITVDNEIFSLVSHPVPKFDEDAVHVGVSLPVSASNAHRYIGNARFALSQTSDSDWVVIADELGALSLLEPGNTYPRSIIADLVAVDHLGDTAPGRELLDTLRVYLRSGTLRSAADKMHLHHSSVAHRLAKLSEHLGYSVDAIENRARATSMMMLTPRPV